MRPFASFGELVLTLSIVFVVFVLSYLLLKALFLYSKTSEKKSFKAAVISAFGAVILLYLSSCELNIFSQKSQISCATLLALAHLALLFAPLLL